MYEVLIVDDERIIREGIKNSIDWTSYDIKNCYVAENGFEALEIIEKYKPNIVITDIKMPGMDGLELIAKVNAIYSKIVFVILSGYGEFSFAHEAMKFGVKNYILKPCNPNEIVKILKDTVLELKEKEKKEKFLKDMDYNLSKILPQVGEQFLKDVIIDGNYSSTEFAYFRKLLKIEEDKFKIVILKLNKKGDLLEKFALKNIAQDILKEELIYLSSIFENNIILLIKSVDLNELMDLLISIKNYFNMYFKSDISIGVSNEDTIENIRKMYIEVEECFKSEFYLGEGKILTEKSITFKEKHGNMTIDIKSEVFETATRNGNIEELKEQLKSFFEILEQEKLEIEMAKTYCIELYFIIIRQGDPTEFSKYADGILKIKDMNTLRSIYSYIDDISYEIAAKNYDSNNKKYGMVINTVLECVDKNLSNSDLSLNWIAKEVLYMNENYLSKLFYKETSEKLSQYVIRMRMEKAKELIKSNADYKIYEITEQIGFEDNTQYFSQVFKKYTGFTPSEYKKHS